MSFAPVLPVYILATLAFLILAVRVFALYQVLVRTAPGRYRGVVLRWLGLTFAALLLVLAALRPGIADEGERQASAAGAGVSDINVFFVVDRSVTSRIPDYGNGQSRMEGIRTDIAELMEKYRSARFGMIGFATKAKVNWPLSPDSDGFEAYVKNLSAYSLTPYDALDFVDPVAADGLLREQLEAAERAYPKSKSLVFYFGDGAVGAKAKPGVFDIPEDLFRGGAVLGYGTPAGGPIPHSFSDGHKNYLGDPKTGEVVRSGIDEARLQAIAEGLGVKYFHREAGKDIVPVLPPVASGSLVDGGENLAKADPLVGRTEWYWVFALISAALLSIEAVLMVREVRRNRLSRSDITAEDVVAR
ncbi:VWA domain-containing protein [Mycolicibacterium goodii]|uniref:vWA domain-containing protein n=1 Tax=Mycolicibacterium goodii TaxID=134601 RepID=UPI001BDC92A1|nr:vWA domain-containing protein [Mycolicibacterium goodii]MBU8809525.1 VWA domain-containing protein [Mycolicibacterium goodii]